ncbi:alpha/beta hydrolase [Dongia sp. agr-C8]
MSLRRPVKLVLRLAIIIAAGLIAFGVTFMVKRPIDAFNWLADRSGYQRDADIIYGDLPRQKLDVYRASSAAPAPVVVFFHGGAWSSGGRGDQRFIGQSLSGRGFTVVVPDYRLSPEVAFPAFLEDGAAALRWTQDHIAEYGGDPRRIFLMGHSAGAYNAMMLALDRRYGEAAGFDAARLRGVVGIAGPYDFTLDGDRQRAIFGAAADIRQTQPVTFAAPGAPPVFLVTGDQDETVDPENSRSLARHLEAAGSPVTLREVAGFRHRGVLLKLSPWYPGGDLRDAIAAFLEREAR